MLSKIEKFLEALVKRWFKIKEPPKYLSGKKCLDDVD